MAKRSLKESADKRERRMALADEEASKPATPLPGKTARQKAVNTEIRIKCTYELSEDTVDTLEASRLKLRRLVGHNVKRYQIVEAALKMALSDLDKLAGEL